VLKIKKIACIIPARLKSTRFPEKILCTLANKPLLQWVWQAASKTTFFSDVIFAIDSEKTAQLIKNFGGKYLMTSKECKSGTDRLIEIMHSGKIKADIWVNWQGDEPFITPQMIQTLLQSCHKDTADVWTLKKLITKKEDINSPQTAKVVCDVDGFALYFSRSTIPYYRDQTPDKKIYYKHVGIYAYTTKALQKIAHLGQSDLEQAEKLEQIRFLQNKISIKVHETNQEVIGIDTPQDLQNAEQYAAQILKIK